MLLRMYMMWGRVEAVHDPDHRPRGWGAPRASMWPPSISKGPKNAYGYLKGEDGGPPPRRIRPYDSAWPAQTSFASVDVSQSRRHHRHRPARRRAEARRVPLGRAGWPAPEQDRVGRALHRTYPPASPRESRSERSQHKNDANALALLKAKLVRREEEKREADFAKKYDEKGEISFGSQIRSYVLQPYPARQGPSAPDHEVGNPRLRARRQPRRLHSRPISG